ncbi:MAG: hypothetical protein U0L12_05330 [Ruminococcus sp.]|nr:hypothetical protein [Ruminococcus sp.]
MPALKNDWIKVKTETGETFGGNQKNFDREFLQKSGCGVIAATDIMLYLGKNHPKYSSDEFSCDKDTLTIEEYNVYAEKLWKKYLPVIPGHGMSGFVLALGMNVYFLRHRIPLFAWWAVRPRKLQRSIDTMLSQELPVIVSVGPNLPFFWKKKKLNLYVKEDGKYISANETRAHYMTIVGREGRWIHLSSWGKEYYADGKEYLKFMTQYSNFLMNNILYLKKIK